MIPFYELQPSDLNIIYNKRELNFRPHIHKYVEILYVFKGGQHLEINDASYVLEEGDAAIIFPDHLHSFSRPAQREAEVVFLICTPEIFGSLFPSLNECTADNPVVTKKSIPEQTVYAFKHLDKANSFAENLGWALIIMSTLLEHIEVRQTHRIPVEDITPKLIKFIDENFTRPLSLDTLADEFHVSRYYISHIFSSKINMNFRSYIGTLRAEYAASLIRTTSDNMTAISDKAGFESQRTFNRVFKAIYNMSPLEYKSNINAYLKSQNQ